jgi:predicted GH43/DUF377 family glycosyl hydrolase
MRVMYLLAISAYALAAPASSSLAQADTPRELERWFAPQSWQRDTEGPIVSLGNPAQFDDMHIFAPAVVHEGGRFLLWYSGSRGTPGNRVFRLGLTTSPDGQQFDKHAGNPVLEFADGAHSVLTPALLRSGDGSVVREGGKLRMWFSSATLGKGGLHTLHQSRSADGIHWDDPSSALAENVYCPSVLKTDQGYEMWFSDVSRRPWVIRHATSSDGDRWTVTPRPALVLSQDWEAEVLVYPTVLKIDGAYLMWYGSYDHAVRRESTAIGFAASLDGRQWHKHPANPVLRPDRERPWESNYVGSGCVMRLADGSFRYWYASRKQPPFLNLYFAINTARWSGPPTPQQAVALRLPPEKGDVGVLLTDVSAGRSVDVLEIVDKDNVIVRAWYRPAGETKEGESTFVDVWIRGFETRGLAEGKPARLTPAFRVAGNELIDTTCGKRSFPLLEPADSKPADDSK